ncbi:cobyrinate a,c-diamide synthase [Polaromonas eurypsychrophila]|uniref:Cobyrinic acid a,c-diamide synthase n=1 Tax=Polaromonas eurypsychrophila TaxID=1614635 RepID=A0A916SKC1_9BURK|nr:cobyrinate a,c-diamide synthase [Polaromonas eurypsychrophila]GGB01714.1 cobyrinic acid a,c-diamide synthase [Polaromonas eurypsychrophila]
MPSASCPAILIAAPASGQGKTTVACALARLFTRQGRRVRVFKCGPDFLDPYWLSLASGAPVHQLDLWMTGEADCAQRLHAAALEADLIIVEGVMGLFDGQPSAADLAQRFDLPLLTVIDASAMAGTFGALAWGLQTYRKGLRFAGVLANRVASNGHAAMLEESLRDPAQWQGALMRSEDFSLPERHLGLVMSAEMDDAMTRLDAAADALAATKLGQMGADALQAWVVDFDAPADAAPETPDLLQGLTIAVARDAAFCFLYAANLDCLQAMGARLVFFSPLADAALPDCDALWLPGGYPELHAATLAENGAMKAAIATHVSAGKQVWAECGGMMTLFDELQAVDGRCFAMWGVLPGRVTMQARLAALGPQQLAVAGGTLRGHTFHYSTCSSPLAPATRTEAAPGRKLRGEGEALYVAGPGDSVKASYFHAWFASSPAAAATLFLKDKP